MTFDEFLKETGAAVVLGATGAHNAVSFSEDISGIVRLSDDGSVVGVTAMVRVGDDDPRTYTGFAMVCAKAMSAMGMTYGKRAEALEHVLGMNPGKREADGCSYRCYFIGDVFHVEVTRP